tara:strand:+ start:1069 stop:1575 length:507 start_codon:yes stop_codon:yes gene_type:complete
MDVLKKVKTTWSEVPMKKRIQSIIDQAKFIGVTITWKQAKSEVQILSEATFYENDTYQVYEAGLTETNQMCLDKRYKNCGLTYLSIKRKDKKSIHDWRDLQEIKNQICGKDREGMEIYPSEDRVVDTANQYHMFVLPKGAGIGLGFGKGIKTDKEYNNNGIQTGQRSR